jgi:hypothetical protein
MSKGGGIIPIAFEFVGILTKIHKASLGIELIDCSLNRKLGCFIGGLLLSYSYCSRRE